MDVRFAPPADDEDAGDAVDLVVQQRGDGVDDVAEPAVLQVDAGGLAGGEVMPCGESDGVPFVGGDDMPVGDSEAVDEGVAQRFELRVGDSEEGDDVESGKVF